MDFAGLVIAGISALGTLVQAYYSARQSSDKVKKSVIRQADKRASQPLKTGTKVVSNVIDDALLEALNKQIAAHHDALINAFTDQSLPESQRAVAVDNARAQICHVLMEIKRFNSGQLPTRRLENLWQSNRC